MILNIIVKYWCILHYHKRKVEYIELRVTKVVLIRVIIGKIIINSVLKSEIGQLFWENIFLQKNHLLWD